MVALIRQYLGIAQDEGVSTDRALWQSGEQGVASDRQNKNVTWQSGGAPTTDLQSPVQVGGDNEVLAAIATRAETSHRKPCHQDAVFVDLKVVEMRRYSLSCMSSKSFIEDRRFDIVTLTWALSGFDLNMHNTRSGFNDLGRVLETILEEIDPSHDLVCHGGGFVPLALKLRWSITYRSVFDTAAYLRFLGIEDSLENGAEYLGLPWHWVQPARPGAPREAVTKAQAAASAQDLEATRRVFLAALKDACFSNLEFWLVKLTSRQNLEGIRIDRKYARELWRTYDGNRERALAELCKAFEDFDPISVGSSGAVKEYCRQAFRLDFSKMSRKNRDVIEAMRNNNKFKKFFKLVEAVRAWGQYAELARKLGRGPARIYGILRYCGARTGRWSSGGVDAESINFQGLPKGIRKGYEALGLLRGVLRPEEGESWVASDLSAIEVRVLLFLAGAAEALDRLRSGEDLYCWFAMQVSPGKVVEKDGENGQLRAPAKEGVISLGYGIGVDAFYTRLLALDDPPDEETARKIYDAYTENFPEVVQLREGLWSAFTSAFDEGRTTDCGNCTFMPHEGPGGKGITVILPTGRPIYYRSVEKAMATSGSRTYPVFWFVEKFTVDPQRSIKIPGKKNQKRSKDGRWRTEVTMPMLVENICQAVARDILAAHMVEIERQEELRVLFHVHDEVVVATRECCGPNRDIDREKGEPIEALHEPDCPWIVGGRLVGEIMSSTPACFPKLMGLPLACDVSQSVRERYGK